MIDLDELMMDFEAQLSDIENLEKLAQADFMNGCSDSKTTYWLRRLWHANKLALSTQIRITLMREEILWNLENIG